MSLDISSSPLQQIATRISLGGSLDSDTAPALEQRLEAILANRTTRLVFDLSELAFVSSAGLRVIFKAQKKVEAAGGEVVMVNLRPQVAKVFEIVKQLPSWSIFQNDAEMDEYLQAIQSKSADQS